MREDDDKVRHFVPLLRRIIILVAVLTAVPVILWTITAFVRSYVGPPKLPTFRELAVATLREAPTDAGVDIGGRRQAAPEPAKISDSSSATAEAKAATADARDVAAPPKGALLGDHPPDAGTTMPTSATKTTDASLAAPPSRQATNVPAAPAWPATPIAPAAPAAAATPDAAAPNVGAPNAQQTAAEAPAEATDAAATPLSGPIPLPRRRPRIVNEAPITPVTRIAQAAPAASAAPVNVPVPRPRPDAAGPAAPPETNGGGALGFFQNLFH